MAVGTYTGNNAAPVSVTGLEFSPEAVFVMGESAQNPVMRVSGMANSTRFTADAGNANRITSLNADGFTVGLDGDVSAVPGTVTFHYVAWNEVKGEMDIGSYTGNAPTDNRNITGVGFSPELVIVKNVTADLPCSVRARWTSWPTAPRISRTRPTQSTRFRRCRPTGSRSGPTSK